MPRPRTRERVRIFVRELDRRGQAEIQVQAQYCYVGEEAQAWGSTHCYEINGDWPSVWEFLWRWLGELQQEAPASEIVLDGVQYEVIRALVAVAAHELRIDILRPEMEAQPRLF